MLYDADYDNSIGFSKKVIEQVSVPNSFRNKKYFYGEFIEQVFVDGLGSVSGDLLFDDFLAALRINKIGGTEDADFNPFICVVNVPELTGIVTPTQDDPDRLDKIEKIVVNLGVFKSYDYIGETPEPGQVVAVSFTNIETYSDPIFEFPLKGASSGNLMDKISNLSGKSSGGRKFFGGCRAKGGSDGEDPRKSIKKAKKPGGSVSPATPKVESSKPPVNKSKPKKPSNKKMNKELPSSKKGKKGLPKCNPRGKTILWKTSEQSRMPQVEAFGKDALFGLDISGWNAPRKIKADAFKKNGVEFVLIKLSHGTSNSNKFITEQLAELRGSGILLAPYHFSSAQRTKLNSFKKRAQREADVFSRQIDNHFGGRMDLVPSIDFESGHGGRRYPQPYGNTTTGHNLNVEFHLELARILRQRYGKPPMVYTAAWARGAYYSKASASLLSNFGSETFLWWAEYAKGSNGYLTNGPVGGSKSRSFRPWKNTDIWQFSGAGQFEDLRKEGLNATFDFNAMRRSTLSKLRL